MTNERNTSQSKFRTSESDLSTKHVCVTQNPPEVRACESIYFGPEWPKTGVSIRVNFLKTITPIFLFAWQPETSTRISCT